MGASSSKDAILIRAGRIDHLIFLVHGHPAMLDRDPANSYGVETRVPNQAVRRNPDRFPDDFMFSLTRPEVMNISQTVRCSTPKYVCNVVAFTEQDVAVLSLVLPNATSPGRAPVLFPPANRQRALLH